MMSYDRFRTGLRFEDVRAIVVQESVARYQQEGQCIRISRNRILGKWKELKVTMYDHYVREQNEAG